MLTSEERTRRNVALTLAEAARRANGTIHQDEPLVVGRIEFGAASMPESAGPDAHHLPQVIRDGAPVDRWVCTEGGLKRWRPIVDQIAITALPDGARLLEIGRQFTIRLDAEQAAHLSRLLGPET